MNELDQTDLCVENQGPNEKREEQYNEPMDGCLQTPYKISGEGTCRALQLCKYDQQPSIYRSDRSSSVQDAMGEFVKYGALMNEGAVKQA